MPNAHADSVCGVRNFDVSDDRPLGSSAGHGSAARLRSEGPPAGPRPNAGEWSPCEGRRFLRRSGCAVAMIFRFILAVGRVDELALLCHGGAVEKVRRQWGHAGSQCSVYRAIARRTVENES